MSAVVENNGSPGQRPADSRLRRKVAVIGSGISGLSAAWLLNNHCDVTVFEKHSYIGGHTNTVIADTKDGPVPVDTGFIVYNEPNYPNLTALFDHLGVATNDIDMHFSVCVHDRDIEYSSSGLSGLFADLRNLTRPRFFTMIADILRFYSAAPRLATSEQDLSLGEFLMMKRYGKTFINDHLLPMAAAIWSCPVGMILKFPAKSFARFFVNHGLVEFGTPFRWRSVDGGSNSYVAPLTAGFANRIRLNTEVKSVRRENDRVLIELESGVEIFDEVVFACHGPQARALLADQDAREREILSAFETQPNRAVLHRDPSLMPRRERAWASWNYRSEKSEEDHLTVTYWMNELQRLPTREDLFVTLNPATPPHPDSVIAEFNYEHPVFDAPALKAQRDIWDIQGARNTWFVGAWLGYGFHEDGLQAGLAVAEMMSGAKRPWDFDVTKERIQRGGIPAPHRIGAKAAA